MIKKEELIKFQKELGLPLSTLEKDYALSLILWGLSQNPTLKTSWVFKGGTCLKKCYFPDYRFSEDLDFTLLPTASVKEADIRHYLQES